MHGQVTAAPAVAAPAPVLNLRTTIHVYDLRDGSTKTVYVADGIWEAPNWSPDGKYLISNSGGAIYKLVLKADGNAVPEKLAIPAEYRCNNDKAVSPDGKWIGFSATKSPGKVSQFFVAKADGTDIRPLVEQGPSYFHGWSPDSKTMAFVAQRNGEKQYDVYRVLREGGAEQRLNFDMHHDDGPDYSPDGKWIYISSDRSGHGAIWRFPADGAGANDAKAEMVIADGLEDWFPHVSPDGKKLVYIGYPTGTVGHNPRTAQVAIKLSPVVKDKVSPTPKLLLTVTGGQGTLNVNSWAPDSQRFAYVTFEQLP